MGKESAHATLMYMSAMIAVMYMKGARVWRDELMAVIDMKAMTALMYTSDMADAPDLDHDLPIFEARNKLGKILERTRYFDGMTFLLNRGNRVGAIVPAELAELVEALGGPAAAAEILRGHLASQG